MEFRDFPDMPKVKPDYFFDTVISTRERRGSNGGPCYLDEGKVNCLIECDGGGFVVRDSRTDGSILLDLETRGGIALNSDCGEGEETYFLSAEPDDGMFLLRPGDPKVCEAQFQTVN